MIRFKFTFDKDEEQEWLNDYCRQGWAMTSFFAGFYTFVPCQPGEFIYQLDLLSGAGFRADDYEGYVLFMHETGVEVVQRWTRWVYLRKRADEGPFEVYTDLDSQIALYQRIRQLFLWVLGIECCCSISVWTGLMRDDGLLFRCLAAVYVLMIGAILRTIWRCARRITDLERQRQ